MLTTKNSCFENYATSRNNRLANLCRWKKITKRPTPIVWYEIKPEVSNTMQIHYLEIVTPDVDASVALYSKIYGISFGMADENLGGAHTAKLANGGTLGIRAPMRDTEAPVVRPYFLVGDIAEAVAAATISNAEIAMPPTEIPGYGKFAILIQGGIQSGLWQV